MKTKRINLRVTDKTDALIRAKANSAGMTITDYIVKCATSKKITNFDGLKELTTQIKKLGNNLNQLLVMARQGRIHVVYLDEVQCELAKIHSELSKMLRGG